MDAKPNEFQKPAGAAVPGGNEPVIHVIPEKFYGAALKKAVSKTPPPGQPPAPPKPPAPAKKKGSPLVPIIIAILLLAAGGAGAFFLLRKPAASPSANVNVAPPAPRCGDAKCDAPGETQQNCSADCGTPAPRCGDAKCDAPQETSASCSADCGAPAPVCGDAKCDAPTETAESCNTDCRPPEPTAGLDADSDGLTDEEERTVFGTNPNDPNTDKDSFVDLNEALNLFDPAKPAPSSLKDNPLIATYSNAAQGYVVLRPVAWAVREGDAEKQEVFFTAPSGEFVQVLTVEKDPGQALMDWYLAQAPGVTSSQVEPYRTRQGYDAILSPDRQTAYVDAGAKVYVVSYNLASRLEVQYKVTFQMIVQSLTKLP